MTRQVAILKVRNLSRGLYYKTLGIRNLLEIDRFHCKLVTFSWDKYTQVFI